LSGIHQQLEMRSLNMAFTGSAHDVVERRREFHDFKSLLAKIAVTANVSVVKTQHMPELMSKCARGQIAGCQSDVSTNEAVRRLTTGCQHRPVLREARRDGTHVDALTPFRHRRHLSNLEFQNVCPIALSRLPQVLDRSLR